jgi:hypothetical protein
MRRLDLPTISFVDCRGDRRLIGGLPLRSRRVLSAHLALAVQIQLEHPDRAIGWLYDNSKEFSDSINICLELCGLSPEYCSAAQVHGLFFAFEGGPGLVLQIEFPDDPDTPAHIADTRDPYHAAIAALWSHCPDLSLLEVRDILEEMPWADVAGAMIERNRIAEEADPRYQEKQLQKKMRDQLLEFFNSDPAIAKPVAAEGVTGG